MNLWFAKKHVVIDNYNTRTNPPLKVKQSNGFLLFCTRCKVRSVGMHFPPFNEYLNGNLIDKIIK